MQTDRDQHNTSTSTSSGSRRPVLRVACLVHFVVPCSRSSLSGRAAAAEAAAAAGARTYVMNSYEKYSLTRLTGTSEKDGSMWPPAGNPSSLRSSRWTFGLMPCSDMAVS